MPVQFRVGLAILQVSVPVNVTRVSLKSGCDSVSMIVRVGVRGALLNFVVISLHSRQSGRKNCLPFRTARNFVSRGVGMLFLEPIMHPPTAPLLRLVAPLYSFFFVDQRINVSTSMR